MWRLCRAENFLGYESAQQAAVLDILVQALQLNPNNCHILADCVDKQNQMLRQNRAVIAQMQAGKLPDFEEIKNNKKAVVGCSHDLLF